MQDYDETYFLKNSTKESYLFFKNEKTNKLAVIFTGATSFIKFDFYKTFGPKNKFNFSSLFFCDIQGSHYINGIPKYSSNIKETCSKLEQLINFHQYKEIFFIGTSMGGFGAIAHSLNMNSLQNVNKIKVIVFNPITYISKRIILNMVKRYGIDKIFYAQQRGITYEKSLELLLNLKKEYKDIETIVSNYKYDKNYKLEIYIVHSKNIKEQARIKRIKKFKNIIYYPFNIDKHNIAGELSKQNKLIALLEEIINK